MRRRRRELEKTEGIVQEAPKGATQMYLFIQDADEGGEKARKNRKIIRDEVKEEEQDDKCEGRG